MVIQTLVLSGMLICAIQAIRAERLLVSALWLAGCSALLALAIGLLGAPEVGVVELSVGAGLVTVIFVFAISIAGEDRVVLAVKLRSNQASRSIALRIGCVDDDDHNASAAIFVCSTVTS